MSKRLVRSVEDAALVSRTLFDGWLAEEKLAPLVSSVEKASRRYDVVSLRYNREHRKSIERHCRELWSAIEVVTENLRGDDDQDEKDLKGKVIKGEEYDISLDRSWGERRRTCLDVLLTYQEALAHHLHHWVSEPSANKVTNDDPHFVSLIYDLICAYAEATDTPYGKVRISTSRPEDTSRKRFPTAFQFLSAVSNALIGNQTDRQVSYAAAQAMKHLKSYE